MSREFRRIEFYPGPLEGEPPAPASITNAYALISHGDSEHQFHQIYGIGVGDQDAREYSKLAFSTLEEAKIHIKNLLKNKDLKYVSMLME